MRWPLKPKLAVARSEEAEGTQAEVPRWRLQTQRGCSLQRLHLLHWFFVLLMFCLWVLSGSLGFFFVRSSFLVLSVLGLPFLVVPRPAELRLCSVKGRRFGRAAGCNVACYIAPLSALALYFI